MDILRNFQEHASGVGFIYQETLGIKVELGGSYRTPTQKHYTEETQLTQKNMGTPIIRWLVNFKEIVTPITAGSSRIEKS